MDTITYKKRCKDCNTEVSDSTVYCPKCGGENFVQIKVIHRSTNTQDNYYQQPNYNYQQPNYNYQQPAINNGSFAGGFCLGFFLGIIGLIVGLCLNQKDTKDGAIKGFIVSLAVSFVFGLLYGIIACSILAR